MPDPGSNGTVPEFHDSEPGRWPDGLGRGDLSRAKSHVRETALASASALALTVALSSTAQAQSPVFNWTGFYVGGNLGAIYGQPGTSTNVACGPVGYICSTATGVQNAAAIAAINSKSGTSPTGGFQAGYNWQLQNFVAGFETDINAYSLSLSRLTNAQFPANGGGGLAKQGYTLQTTADSSWLLTARGRVGAAFANVLVYATGGLAMTQLRVSNSYSDTKLVTGFAANEKIKYGWTVGGGLEWVVATNWTLKAEYLYVSFGSVSASSLIGLGPGYANLLTTSAHLNAQIARLGLNYHF